MIDAIQVVAFLNMIAVLACVWLYQNKSTRSGNIVSLVACATGLAIGLNFTPWPIVALNAIIAVRTAHVMYRDSRKVRVQWLDGEVDFNTLGLMEKSFEAGMGRPYGKEYQPRSLDDG